VFALAAVGGVIIGVVDMREGGGLDLGVFHALKTTPAGLWIAGVYVIQ